MIRAGTYQIKVPSSLARIDFDVVSEKDTVSTVGAVSSDMFGNVRGGGTQYSKVRIEHTYLSVRNLASRPIVYWSEVRVYSNFKKRIVDASGSIRSPSIRVGEAWRHELPTMEGVVLSDFRIIDPDTDQWIERHEMEAHLGTLSNSKWSWLL